MKKILSCARKMKLADPKKRRFPEEIAACGIRKARHDSPILRSIYAWQQARAHRA